MTARWPHVERLYHEALAIAPGDRAAFVREACGGDAELLMGAGGMGEIYRA